MPRTIPAVFALLTLSCSPDSRDRQIFIDIFFGIFNTK